MQDPKSYFARREASLRAVGLDPDDDEVWALPDYEIPTTPAEAAQLARHRGWQRTSAGLFAAEYDDDDADDDLEDYLDAVDGVVL